MDANRYRNPLQKRQERLAALPRCLGSLLHPAAGEEIWLFGSLARGDWDALSDVDLIAVAASQEEANALGDRILAARQGDDVLCFDREGWRRRIEGDDPYWRGIRRDAIFIAGGASA